jgi:hypothetical protein
MALTTNHPFHEQRIYAFSPNVGSTAASCAAYVPFRSKVMQVGMTVGNGGAVGATDITVSTFIAASGTNTGTAITGGNITVTSASGFGLSFTATPTGANYANEGDAIYFEPGGSTGSCSGHFFAVLRPA